MSKYQTGPKNGQWKGGRTITDHGYVLVRLLPDSPFYAMADCRGYVYEHRLVVARILGRPLTSTEQVHHRDDKKRADNDVTNLVHAKNMAAHRLFHRKPTSRLRLPTEGNPLIECACECGGMLYRFDSLGRPRQFISGHNMRTCRGPDAAGLRSAVGGDRRHSAAVDFVGNGYDHEPKGGTS